MKLLIVGKKAKVAFDYEAQDADELTLHMGDVVDFMEEVEEGWWKGKLHGKVGVFPSNFVEMIEEEDTNPNQDKPAQIKSNSQLFDITCACILWTASCCIVSKYYLIFAPETKLVFYRCIY